MKFCEILEAKIAEIPIQKQGLERCTAVSCNAILNYFKKNLITSVAEVPHNAKECFALLLKRGLKVQPEADAELPKNTNVIMFANRHPKGVWLIGTNHHAMALIDGVLYDTENKGLDSRMVEIVAAIV